MLQTITAATAEPVDLETVRGQLWVTHNDDDVMLERLISSARWFIEDLTGRALVAATYRYTGRLTRIPRWPATVETVEGLDDDGTTWVAISSDDYTFDVDRNLLVETDYCHHKIDFTAVPSDPIPQPLLDSIILRVQADYERDPNVADRYREAAYQLAFPYRVSFGG